MSGTIGVVGAGAFGGALAISQASANRSVLVWGRDAETVGEAQEKRILNRLPETVFPANVSFTPSLSALQVCDILLLAVPMQSLRDVLGLSEFGSAALVACCKGIDLHTGLGPVATIQSKTGNSKCAVLTGPSFAADLAKGLPTALTLASKDETLARHLQSELATPSLRLYRSTDPTGAELGGGLKNVVAIAAGMAYGSGFGESARAAVITRGFAEVQRLALKLGARPETFSGLSGFGDLVLTATSVKSRNFRFGMALGSGEEFDPSITVEGAATARAVLPLAKSHGVEMPLTGSIVDVLDGRKSPTDAAQSLLSRPLKPE